MPLRKEVNDTFREVTHVGFLCSAFVDISGVAHFVADKTFGRHEVH